MRVFVLVLALACGLLAPLLSASPTPAPTLHLGPAATEPTRVLLLGDSIALTLGVGLAKNSEHYGVTLTNRSTLGCDLDTTLEIFTSGKPGPATPGCDNWQTLWPSLAASVHPQVVVLGLGRWEVTNHLYQGHWVHIGQPVWNAHLTDDFDQAIAIFERFGAKVVLLTMPYIDPSDRQPDGKPWVENTPERANLYNAFVRKLAAAHSSEVSVLDLNKMLDPDGVYTATVDGVTTRWSDGIHLSTQGGEFLRSELLPPIHRLGYHLVLDAAETRLHAQQEVRTRVAQRVLG
jgi:hypothetical protein